MADDTHLKLAHNLLGRAQQVGHHGPERQDKIALAHTYAVLAVAEALDRIATAIEQGEPIILEPATVETFQSGPRPEDDSCPVSRTGAPHLFPAPGVPCACGALRPS